MRGPGKVNKLAPDFGTVRDQISRNKRTAFKVFCVLAVLLLSVIVHISNTGSDIVIDQEQQYTGEETGDAGPAETAAETAAEVPMYIDISGAVKSPGVYCVPPGTRLFELIEMAGGLDDNADIDSINQAAYVTDGDKVVIPEIGGENISRSSVISNGSANNTININTADKEDLKKLPGVGDVLADRIIEYRTNNRFQKIEDIKNVSGIGDATFEKMKGQLSV